MANDTEAIKEQSEHKAVERASGLSSRLVYEVVRRDGEEELRRPNSSLFWSGIAAGILISFSVLGEALLRTSLPDAPWRYLIENMGYSLGFLLVILGRMQLFTENTITTVLPLVARPDRDCIRRVGVLWSVVLGANLIGCAVAGTFFAYSGVFDEGVATAITDLSEHATGFPPLEAFLRGIPAGILIAAIVWMLPSAGGNAFMVIFVFTWLIALGDFTHVVAGSVEMAYLLVQGEAGLGRALFDFFLPVLFGNIVGGTLIFTLLAWGQVRDEVVEEDS